VGHCALTGIDTGSGRLVMLWNDTLFMVLGVVIGTAAGILLDRAMR